MGQLRCEEREFSYRLGGWKVCVDRKSGMPEGPGSRMEEDVHRKPQLYLLNFVISLV
jgi:hypothetical protein